MRSFLTGRFHRRTKRLLALSLIFGAIAALGAVVPSAASPGRAKPEIKSPPREQAVQPPHALGLVPKYAGGAAAKTVASPVSYHGGPVQHGATEIAIFWYPPGYYMTPAYRGLVDSYFTDVSAGNYTHGNVYSVATQYYDLSGSGGSKNFVGYQIGFGGQIIDHDTYPTTSTCPNYTLDDGSTTTACITDSQVEVEVSKLAAARKLPTGLGEEYFVYLPQHVGECMDPSDSDCYDPKSQGGYCAYHSYVFATMSTLYAVVPYDNVTGCVAGNAGQNQPVESPNADDADPAISDTSHELSETLTDPLGTAWYSGVNSGEIGDQCAYTFGPATRGFYPSGEFNQAINGDVFWTQEEWSNLTKSCLQRTADPQPAVSFSTSLKPTHGVPIFFTPAVHDTDDTSFTYSWAFGDGTRSALVVPIHTYAKPGTYAVALVVTDAHGDAVRVVKNIVVA